MATGEATSTIARADYIGPDACGDCHAAQYAMWQGSLHRTMNQRAADAKVLGAAGTVTYAGGEMTFAKDASAYVMTLARGNVTTRYRVTRTIGTHGLQEYVGTELPSGTEEVRLPFAWWPRAQGWFAQPYFDPWFAKETDFDAYAPVKEPWAERCPWCHSTYPFELRIARSSAKNIGHGFEQFFTSTTAPAQADRLAVDEQVTTGISCESCHLGGRAHRDGAPIHFVPIGAASTTDAPRPTTFKQERADATVVNRVCAQCHSGPSPRLADGTSLRNSSEALDLAASTCKARCTDCHDPHALGSDEKRANAACVTCHDRFASADAGKTHASHESATTCLDCHMPKVVMGIDHVVRTHRISSPTNATILETAGPNACNLCHLDRSITWMLDELKRGWDVTPNRAGLAPHPKTYGDLDAPVGEVWLASKEPALRLLATDAYARGANVGLLRIAWPLLVGRLTDELPHLRAWAWFAVQTAAGRLGKPVAVDAFDPRAPTEQRARAIERLRTHIAP
ncbi:MAG TPA: ammonia-forming cytochrome c nitrite reductase subunit c552 [Kofleriaceae bacterium]